MEDKVGFGFRPNDEELVGYYLRHKIEGNTSLVDEAISEVNICSFDPWDLRFQSKYKSKDPTWYFFSRRENTYGNGGRQKRATKSGKWKMTGESVKVMDQWGISSGVRGEIGSKNVVPFIDGRYPKKKTSDWVIHEFHYTLVPEHLRTYVICRLHYKGDDADILSATATAPTPIPTLTHVANMTSSQGSVVNQSFQGNSGSYNTYPENDSAHHFQQFNDNFNMQPAPQGNLGSFNIFPEYDSAYLGQNYSLNFDMQLSEPFNPFPVYDMTNHDQWLRDYPNLQQQITHSALYDNELQNVIGQNYEYVVGERTTMQENYSAYRPKKTETGVIADDSSDTETDSMIFEDTSSLTNNVGSSNELNHTPKDNIPALIEPWHDYEAQEQPKQPELPCHRKEKVKNTEKRECERKMAEDSLMKHPSTKMVKQSWVVMENNSKRSTQWNYLKNMIIGFVVFISIIGWIILVG